MHIKRKPDIVQLQTNIGKDVWIRTVKSLERTNNEADSHAVTFQAIEIPCFAVENCIPS